MKTSVFKKAVALLVCALMLFSTLVISAGAATVATLTVAADGDSYNVGDTVKVTASVSGAGSFQSMGLTIAYDDVLELVGGGWLAEDAVIADYTVGNAKAAMTFEADTAFSGDVFYLEFVVLEAATFGDYNVTLTPVIKTEAGAVVECAAGTATVTVACAHGMGDVAYDDEYHWDECGECGEDLNKAAHEFDNDCDSTCNGCEYTREVGDHVYDNDCDAECNICGAIREVGDHTWGDYDYDDDGHWQTCVNGDATTEKVGHKYGDWIVETPATTNGSGSKYRECVCGHKETAVIPQTLKFASATLGLESSIAIDFLVSPDYFTKYGYTNPYVVFTVNGRDPVTVRDYTINSSNGRYTFTFSDLGPYMMSETVNAVVYAEYNGEIYESAVQPYGVVTYCQNQLKKSAVTSNVKLRTLIVDLLNYGTAAQLQWNYNTDNLANSFLTEEQKAWATTDDAYATAGLVDYRDTTYKVVDNALAQWKGCGLTLEEAVVMDFRFVPLNNTDVNTLSVKVTTDEGKSWTIGPEAFEYISASQGYYVHFDSLYAFEMRDFVYFTLYVGDTAVSNTVRYSVESYSARYATSAYADLIEAMMKYGDSAAAYFG